MRAALFLFFDAIIILSKLTVALYAHSDTRMVVVKLEALKNHYRCRLKVHNIQPVGYYSDLNVRLRFAWCPRQEKHKNVGVCVVILTLCLSESAWIAIKQNGRVSVLKDGRGMHVKKCCLFHVTLRRPQLSFTLEQEQP